MKCTGISFYVEGEYVTESDWHPLADPKDQDWIPFDNSDIHPWSKPFFTAWSQFDELTEKDVQEMADQIVEVINWLYQERDWVGFCATLWLHRGQGKPQRMFRWEIC
jgi:hypothetical protein